MKQPRWVGRQMGCSFVVLILQTLGAIVHAEPGESAKQVTSVCLTFKELIPGCPTPKQLEVAVEEILGHRVFSVGSCDIQVGGTMRVQPAGGWQTDLTFVTSQGEVLGKRVLQTPAQHCSALKDPVSLVISLMVEAREAEVILKVPLSQPPAQRSASMAVSFSLASGLLPDLAKGATAEVGWKLSKNLPLHLQSTYWFPDVHLRAGRGGEFWSWVGGAALCPTVLQSTYVEGSVCGGIQAGILHGTGVGYNNTGAPSKPYGEATARFRLAFPFLRPLHGFLEVGVATPWLRPSFVYSLETTGALVEVHRPRILVFFGGIGLQVHAADGS